MNSETKKENSSLIAALREAIGVVQMILFKEVRSNLEKKSSDLNKNELPMLAGAIINEIFGTPNPEKRFADFRHENWGIIEQELLAIPSDFPFLCKHITDALRTQVLCDNQLGADSSSTLVRAKEYGILMADREVPLPSTFMAIVRELGKQHNLIIPPLQISPEQDDSMVH